MSYYNFHANAKLGINIFLLICILARLLLVFPVGHQVIPTAFEMHEAPGLEGFGGTTLAGGSSQLDKLCFLAPRAFA